MTTQEEFARKDDETNEEYIARLESILKASREDARKNDEKAKREAEHPDLNKIQKVINPKSFTDFVILFLQYNYQDEITRLPMLVFFDGNFYAWDGVKYVRKSKVSVRSELYEFVPKLWHNVGKDTIERIQPTTELLNQIIDALQCRILIEPDQVPCWLEDSSQPIEPLEEFISCKNGILHLPTKELRAGSPAFFTLSAIDYNYQPGAERTYWIAYLDSLWEDKETKILVQEIFGLCLSDIPNRTYQKGFIVKGPTRAGKGTIFGDVLPAIIGHSSFVGKSLNTLAERFGCANLPGKKALVVPDARIEGNRRVRVTELLLNIISGDPLSHDRKNSSEWEGALNCKVIICSNDLPQFKDNTGTIAGRFLYIQMTKSFLGKEDTELAEKLLKERSGILDWAIDGYNRLRNNRKFTEPKASKELRADARRLSSTMLTFVEDCCEFGQELPPISVEAVYEAYKTWRTENGVWYTYDKSTFSKDFLEACPQVTTMRPRSSEGRPQHYVGVRLRKKRDENLLCYKHNKPKPCAKCAKENAE